jgi:hypothetical protein
MGQLGSLFSSANMPAIASGTSLGLGEIGNLIAGSEASSQQKQLQNQENAITSLTPAQLTQKVNAAAQPISAAEMQNIGNQVQGDVASRGLAQAPGIFASEESQALAPLVQQNYQTALAQVMQQLGLPLQYAQAISQFLPKQTSMTPAMSLFLQQLARLKGANAGNGGVTTGPNLGQLSPPPDSGSTYGDTGSTSTDPFAGISSLLGVSS